MNVSLSPELQRLIDEKVDSGAYATPDDVVTAALRLLHERDALWHAHEDTICKQVAQGLDSLDAGRGVTVSDTELFSAARDAYRGG